MLRWTDCNPPHGPDSDVHGPVRYGFKRRTFTHIKLFSMWSCTTSHAGGGGSWPPVYSSVVIGCKKVQIELHGPDSGRPRLLLTWPVNVYFCPRSRVSRVVY